MVYWPSTNSWNWSVGNDRVFVFLGGEDIFGCFSVGLTVGGLSMRRLSYRRLKLIHQTNPWLRLVPSQLTTCITCVDRMFFMCVFGQVPLPFPCCTSRQMVYRRVVTLLSPIECSIDDIGGRIVTMREEVQAGIDRASDTRGLTRLVQGSVLPQVSGRCCRRGRGRKEGT